MMIGMEFLNTITLVGMPPHCMALKVGVPVILLRNLNVALGLCNGTCLIIWRMA
jgi:ATP-dependent DNA helicase PIF1